MPKTHSLYTLIKWHQNNVVNKLIGLLKWIGNKPWTRYPPGPLLPRPGEPTSKCKRRIAVEINKWPARAYIMLQVCVCLTLWQCVCCTAYENMYGKIYVINCPTGSSASQALCVSSDLHTLAASDSDSESVRASAPASAATLATLRVWKPFNNPTMTHGMPQRSRAGLGMGCGRAGRQLANETV